MLKERPIVQIILGRSNVTLTRKRLNRILRMVKLDLENPDSVLTESTGKTLSGVLRRTLRKLRGNDA